MDFQILNLPLPQVRQQDNSPAKITPVRIGFEMDLVKSVLNLEKFAPEVNSEILYVEDPVYYKFKHNELSYKGDLLVIEGHNLNLAADENDVDVRIGNEKCNVTSLTSTQMLCIPPLSAPTPIHASHPEVVVYVGKNLKFEIGLLRYDIGGPFTIPPEVIGGIGAAAALTLFIAIAFMIIYKHKSSQAEREYKRIQVKNYLSSHLFIIFCPDPDGHTGEQREERVQTGLRRAADRHDRPHDGPRDLRNPASRPQNLRHESLLSRRRRPSAVPRPKDPRRGEQTTNRAGQRDAAGEKCDQEKEREIILTTFPLQFEGLLNNKWFLLAFIETMERQKSFTIRWRKTLNFLSFSKTDIVFPRQGPSELRLSCHRDPHVQDGVLHRYTQVGKINVMTKCKIFFT